MDRLLNECMNCKMRFESSEHLNKHIDKFCSKSRFGGNLDELYEQKLKERNTKKDEKLEFKPSIYADLKHQIVEDDLIKQLEKKADQNRRDQIDDEIDQIKNKRQNVRVDKQKDQDILYDMIKKEEMEKE